MLDHREDVSARIAREVNDLHRDRCVLVEIEHIERVLGCINDSINAVDTRNFDRQLAAVGSPADLWLVDIRNRSQESRSLVLRVSDGAPESIASPYKGAPYRSAAAIFLLHTDIRESPAERIISETYALLGLNAAQYLAPHGTIQGTLAATAFPDPLRVLAARNLQGHEREFADGDDSRMTREQQCQERGARVPPARNVDVGRGRLASRIHMRHKYLTRNGNRSRRKIVAHFNPFWQPTSSPFQLSNPSLTNWIWIADNAGMIAHKLKTIFIHITKSAGSSIEVALNEVEKRDDGAIDPATGDFVKVVTGPEKHMTARAVQEFVGDEVWNSYYKFSVVRNPFDRFHSLWWNGRYVGKRHSLAFQQFTDFALHRTLKGRLRKWRTGEWKVHQRFWPQARFLQSKNGKMEIDQVLHFESISEDFAELANRIGLPSTHLPKVLMENRRPESRHCYADDYDDQTRAIVADFYRDDIETFGYDFE